MVAPAERSAPGIGVMLVAAFLMLVSTGFEVLWAIYMVARIFRVGGRAEADDIDSLKWIARTFIPLTCLCSWLVWSAFLYSAGRSYCPSNQKWLDVTWGLVPVASNLSQLVAELYA